MESADLDMDEIFDDHDEDEDIGALPDLPDATQSQDASQENEEAENAEVLARLKDLSKGASKKVVRRPQPKLDPTRLSGARGIPILAKQFEKVKFKGKGHEASDLALIMKQLEHWGHRLFPKMPFDEVLERVERLGTKKEVQTCVKKIRMDMPILDDDFVGSDREDDVDRVGDAVNNQQTAGEDVWDEMLREEEEQQSTSATPSRKPSSAPSNHAETIAKPSKEPEFTATRIEEPTAPGGFTSDQLARIERNKQLAMERRLKKTGHITPGKPMPSPASQSQPQQLESRSTGNNSQPTQSTLINPKGDIFEATQNDRSTTGNTIEDSHHDRPEIDDDTSLSLSETRNRTGKLHKADDKKVDIVDESKGKTTDNDKNDSAVEVHEEMSKVIEKQTSQNITLYKSKVALGGSKVRSDENERFHDQNAADGGTSLEVATSLSGNVIPDEFLDSDEEMSIMADVDVSQMKVLKSKEENVDHKEGSDREKNVNTDENNGIKLPETMVENVEDKENINTVTDVGADLTEKCATLGAVDMKGDHAIKVNGDDQMNEAELMDTLDS
ncbi:TIMELESS-interacting protein-like [Dreissena polymorpha]|uniref:TIMELESS-interacting protein n=1 Tax=Dreissena polymorpha TaxID=45954 RepID=A0A9D4FKU9_DREPO|nr:TIMELESS-interacting protein-like [Dreissena polymorpha]XP_052221763.1 TIMELESS-interacting protein-like [Dreissena polymorpha]KAH3797672.1 hypothetical protein DPMN_151257 [Dreissena polymorpha]